MSKDVIIVLLERQLNAANGIISSLRDTITSLEKTIESQRYSIKNLENTIKNLEELLRSKDITLTKANSQLKQVNALYAPKKSEKQALNPTPKTPEQITKDEQARKEAIKARGNNGAKRNPHFELETQIEHIYPDGIKEGEYKEIGVSEVIRYKMIPPRFLKIIKKLHKVVTPEGIVAPKIPYAPIHHSNFDGSFIAGTAQLRYLYSMSVERIVSYFNENGFNISKQTTHNLLKKTAVTFENIYLALGEEVKKSNYINCDETYHTVLEKGAKAKGEKSTKGYIWVAASQENGLCYFFYDDGSRKQKVIFNELKGYSGIIQSDGLRAYKNLEKENSGIVKVACLQHCKRQFLEKEIMNNPDAKKVAKLAGQIYHNEQKHRIGEKGWTVEDNLRWRQEYAPPILAKLKEALLSIKTNRKYPPDSKIVKAANYFLNEWDGIEAISRYGDVSWDNNFLERLNRYISLSRHNSLFFGSHAGAKRGCFFYSLACSCRLNKINFFDYLTDVLNRAAAIPPGAGLDAYRDLLPDRWKPSQEDNQ